MTAAAISGGKRRSRSEGESERASPEHAGSPAPSSRSSTKQQVRHRASIACASCRERRIRCVVSEGGSECAQCKRTGATCVIKDDDERRRPISKAYMSSLSNRIALLEEMLKERGVDPPPAVHPPKTRQEAQARQQQEQQHQAHTSEERKCSEPNSPAPPVNRPPTPPGSGDEDAVMVEPEQPTSLAGSSHANFARLIDPLLLQDVEEKRDGGTRHLLCTRGTYNFDQSAGRLRFFGPTASIHVHADSTCGFAVGGQSDEDRRVERLIGALPPSTHSHLMRCFWEYPNSWLQVVDRSAFEAGRTTKDRRFYSPFLHLTMLATGYRFADWDREDVKKITLGNRESTLHKEAKSLLEVELDKPGGIPSVQALLLLADLEYGVGRDSTGWLYSGMANRLAFDIGLHANPNGAADISELGRQTRRQAMAACIMSDRKWAVLLGRPTTIKIQDVAADALPRTAGGPLADSGIGHSVASHAAICRQMFELLDLGGRVADFQNTIHGAAHVFSTKASEDKAYLHFVGVERLFHNWYRRLPENLSWNPVNIKSAPMGFFALHQQFHVCMILLHRPWAKYGPMSLDGSVSARYPSPESPGRQEGTGHLPPWVAPHPPNGNRASMSRSMCTQHAIRVARIFWHHRQRFDGRRVGLAAIQHAGTAALALMAALAHKSAELDHQSNLRYLQVLSTAIYDMSHLYQPAARMYQLLKSMLVEIRSEMVKSGGFDVGTFVGRCPRSSNPVFGSSHWDAGIDSLGLETAPDDGPAAKRRRLSRLPSVDLTCLAPSLGSTHPTGPIPPGPSQNHEGSNAILDQAPGESPTFDMAFFHASFGDFISSGGDGAASGSQDWAVTGPSPENADAPMLLPTASGDLSFVSGAFNTSEAPKPNDSPAAIAAPPTTAAPAVDDDTAVDKTIEEWLAEPARPSPAPMSDTNARQNQPTTTTTTTTAIPEPQSLSPPADPPAEIIHPSAPRSSLSRATADGTPICRDPYVLSLETELGLTLGAAAATPGSGSSDASASGVSESGASGSSRGGGIEAMDWLPVVSPTPAPAAAPAPAPAPQSILGDVDARPPVPMTPVTLDELVQSVEEAVGSARARARARAAAAGAGGEAGVGSTGGSNDNAVAAVGAGVVVGRNSVSPVVRNRELDFLTL